MKILDNELQIVKSLVGAELTHENLTFIDCFIHRSLSIFMPVGGNCGYAINPDHSHPSYMFVISYDNETEVYIGANKYRPHPNSLFCLSPDIKHHEVQNYLPPKYCAIFVEKEFFELHFKEYASSALLPFNGLIINIKNNRLDALVKEFICESQNLHLSKDIVLKNIATLLIHQIIRNIIEYDFNETIFTNNLVINEVIKFINIHYENSINIDDLAKLSNLSKSHFTKLFTDEMQVSPIVYLKMIRLQNAKKILLSKQLSITQVAQQCGFNSPSYFTKIFKETFNETPKEFLIRSK